MFAVLLIGVGSHLRGGLTVWSRATQTGETLQQQRLAMEQLERDLANGLIYDDRAGSYGTTIGLLPSPAFDRSTLAWYTVSSTRRQPPSVQFVTSACGTVQNASGLWRTSQSIGAARAQQAATPQRLLPGCQALAIRYAYQSAAAAPLEWYDEWTDPIKELPRLLEITVTLEGQSLTRVFAIPSGVLKAYQPPT